MNDLFLTMAVSAVISVSLGVFLRQRGWGIAIPLLVAGALVGAVPIGPYAPPEPEVVLIAVLAPLVFGEALGSSYLDLRRVRRPILALAIGLVVLTTLAVGGVAAFLVSMPLAMAFALGAVLAPTDAVAVTSVARRAGLPRRVVSILEGESLVNDGTGLTALKVSLVAAAAGSVTLLEVGWDFTVAVVVGVAVGGIGGLLLAWVLRVSRDLTAANALVVVAPFAIYLIAERFEGSGILAVVVAALLIANRQNADPGHAGRVQSVTVWKHLTFVLQCLAFFLVGLEIPEVVPRAVDTHLDALLILVPAVLVTIIVVRTLFVFSFAAVRRALGGRDYTFAGLVIVSCAIARGPVSGLAAFTIPVAFLTGEAVPFRDLILATTFIIIVLTLLLSLALAPLARALDVGTDDDEDLLRRVDVRLARAALDRLTDLESQAQEAGEPIPHSVSERLRSDVERRMASLAAGSGDDVPAEVESRALSEVGCAMIRAEQEELIAMRDQEGLPDVLVRPLLRHLDVREHAMRNH